MALLSFHSARRGFLGFLTYITGSDSIPRGGVIPAFVQVDSTGAEAPAGTVGNPIFVSGASGGGAATIADGADVAEGATTDAVVAAGAAGTVSAKLRRLTTDISALLTQLPATLGAKTGALSLSVVPNTDTPFKVAGVDADAAAPTVNPLAIAGQYTSGALGGLATGQLGRLTTDVNRNLRVLTTWIPSSARNITYGFGYGQQSQTGTTTQTVPGSVPFIDNGTSLDVMVKPNVVARLLSSAATTNATSVKATAGNIFRINGNNTVASKRYLKLYNKASAPTVGTDTPVMTIVLLASAGFDFSIPPGMYFGTGIAYAITGAAADADTTAIVAGDIECLNILYS